MSRIATVVRQATTPDGLPGRVHLRFPPHSRGNKCRRRRPFAAFGPLHGDPKAAGAYQPNPAALRRRKGPRRRTALRGAKSAAESAARLPGRCRSGIESSRGSFPHTSGGTGPSGPLACRRRCTASGFCRPGCSTALLSRCGLNVSFHVYHRERI